MFMKKFHLILFLLLFIKPLQAQFSLGISGNLNYSGISGNAPSNTIFNKTVNFGAGVLLDYKINDEIILSFQPMYARRGAMLSYDLPSYKEPRDSLRMNLDYFSFPLLLKFPTNKTVYFIGGIEFAFLNAANYKAVNYDLSGDIKDLINSFDILADFGVGLQFKVNEYFLIFEGRFSQGLMNGYASEKVVNPIIPVDFKNSSLQLLISVKFDL